MTYSDEFKVCWFTPMRTATRSTHTLLTALRFRSLGTHSFIYPPERLGYKLISNIRNPYSRIVSLFSLYSIHKNEYTFNFNNWCEYALTDEKFDSEYQLRYEKKILSLNKKFDKFIRVENLGEDIKSLSFIDIENPKIEEIWRNIILNNRYTYEFKNIENNERKHWSNFYTERLADFVYENLKEQFELFDYNKDSWKNGTP